MKPFIALAAAAPFLLLAGAGHAAQFSFSDANCSSFSIDANGVISCVTSTTTTPTVVPSCTANVPSTGTVGSSVTISASCTPGPITAYTWTASAGAPAVGGPSTTVNLGTEGTYTYQVKAENAAGIGGLSAAKTITVSPQTTTPPPTTSSCPTPPAGTVIVAIGGKDNYALKDFDVVFDNPGATFDSAVAAGQSKALQFTNGKSLAGYLSSTAGNYGNGYKDFALSLCPGDFSTSLGAKCVLTRKTSINMGYSTNGSLGCTIPANQTVYLNVRGTDGAAAGWVMQNLQMTAQ